MSVRIAHVALAIVATLAAMTTALAQPDYPTQAGKLRAIAVTSAKRSLGFSDLPTIAESGVRGYDVTSWNGMLAPAGTPKEIITRRNTEYNKIIASPDIRKWMIGNGYDPVGGAPEKFGKHIRAELAKWAPVVKAAGFKVD